MAADCDLIVVGGGSAGLGAARSAVASGARALLVTDGEPGGECTFTGCVPSKALIEAAARGASYAESMAAAAAAVATVAATETPEILARQGIEVLRGRAAFTGPGEITVGSRTLRARAFVVATGSRPAVPSGLVRGGLAAPGSGPGIPGGSGDDGAEPTVPYLTTENVFDLPALPTSLVVLGGGPVGCWSRSDAGRPPRDWIWPRPASPWTNGTTSGWTAGSPRRRRTSTRPGM